MAERDGTAVARFIERFALDLTGAGMPRMPSRVFAALMTADSGALTAGELSDLLQVSPASVSGAVRYLEHLGLIIRAREPGSRRDHYRVEQDLWYSMFTQRDRMLLQWIDTVRDGVALLGRDTPAGDRMAESAAFFEFLHDEMLDLNERWHDRRAERRRAQAAG